MSDAGPDIVWQRSSRSTNGGIDCVEVAFVDGTVLMRDSKSAMADVLVFDPPSWSEFLRAVKAGEFDRP